MKRLLQSTLFGLSRHGDVTLRRVEHPHVEGGVVELAVDGTIWAKFDINGRLAYTRRKDAKGYFEASSADIYDGDFSHCRPNDYDELWQDIGRMIEEEKTAGVHRRLNERDAHKQAQAAPAEAPEASMP